MTPVYRKPAPWLLAVMLLLSPLLGACLSASTYKVRRAALVHPPAPPAWSGRVEAFGAAIGDSTVVWHKPPRRHEESDSGLYVARTQLDANLHMRIGENFGLWFPLSYGLADGAFPAAPCSAEAPRGGVFSGGGIGLAGSGYIARGLYIGGSLEGQLSLIPSRIETREVEWGSIGVEEETTIMPVLRGSLMMGYDFGWWRLYGGVSVRNHPTNTQLTTETAITSEDIDADIEFGPLYALPGLGVEFDIGDHVSIAAQAYQPLAAGAVDLIYGPIVGLTFDFHAPRERERASEVEELAGL